MISEANSLSIPSSEAPNFFYFIFLKMKCLFFGSTVSLVALELLLILLVTGEQVLGPVFYFLRDLSFTSGSVFY